jgi:hypothetical protein
MPTARCGNGWHAADSGRVAGASLGELRRPERRSRAAVRCRMAAAPPRRLVSVGARRARPGVQSLHRREWPVSGRSAGPALDRLELLPGRLSYVRGRGARDRLRWEPVPWKHERDLPVLRHGAPAPHAGTGCVHVGHQAPTGENAVLGERVGATHGLGAGRGARGARGERSPRSPKLELLPTVGAEGRRMFVTPRTYLQDASIPRCR